VGFETPGDDLRVDRASRLEQVDENVRALGNLKFEAEEMTKIDRVLQ
jgi:aryl-alcohol dehydrogenase-like predicted oxidoreductase